MFTAAEETTSRISRKKTILRRREQGWSKSMARGMSLSIHVTYLNVRAMISTVQPRMMTLGSGFSRSYSSPWSLIHKQWLRCMDPSSFLYDSIFPPDEYFCCYRSYKRRDWCRSCGKLPWSACNQHYCQQIHILGNTEMLLYKGSYRQGWWWRAAL